MADEMNLQVNLNYTKDKVSLARNVTQKITVSGADYSDQTQDVSNSAHEALSINSDIGTKGVVYIRNLDATNYVEVGVDVSTTFYPLIKIKPGEMQVWRLAAVSPYVKANTATVKIQVLVFED